MYSVKQLAALQEDSEIKYKIIKYTNDNEAE